MSTPQASQRQLFFPRTALVSAKRKSLIHHIEDLSKRFDTYPEGVEEVGYQMVDLMQFALLMKHQNQYQCTP